MSACEFLCLQHFWVGLLRWGRGGDQPWSVVVYRPFCSLSTDDITCTNCVVKSFGWMVKRSIRYFNSECIKDCFFLSLFFFSFTERNLTQVPLLLTSTELWSFPVIFSTATVADIDRVVIISSHILHWDSCWHRRSCDRFQSYSPLWQLLTSTELWSFPVTFSTATVADIDRVVIVSSRCPNGQCCYCCCFSFAGLPVVQWRGRVRLGSFSSQGLEQFG